MDQYRHFCPESFDRLGSYLEELKANRRRAAEKTGFEAAVGKPTITLTRVLDASRQRVFDACTQPDQLTRWWGPRGFVLSTCEIDLRPGGAYRFVQRGPDGKEHAFKGIYREIVPPERLVYTQCLDVEPWASREELITMTLTDQSAKTKLTINEFFTSVEDRDAVLNFGGEDGAIQSLDRLADFLGGRSSAQS
jgi:uncharacterized protein YndB with AHSA1/START domain